MNVHHKACGATEWHYNKDVCGAKLYTQQLSRPVLWFVAVCATYWTHTTAVCVLMVALTRLQLPTHPPPPYTCHL